MSKYPGKLARFTIAGAIASRSSLLLAASPARAQAPLWPDAPWRAFVTGSYPAGLHSDLARRRGPRRRRRPGRSGRTVLLRRSRRVRPLEPRRRNLPAAGLLRLGVQDRSVGEVALADFDGDGDLDAFATIRGVNDDEAKLLVWRNNGAGTLAAPVEFTTGLAPVGIVVADFTGDGKPDVATANYAFSAMTVSFLEAQRADRRRRRFPAQDGHRDGNARRGSGRRRRRRRRPPGSRGGRVSRTTT